MRLHPSFLVPALLAACGEGAPPHAYITAATAAQDLSVCAAGATLQGADVSFGQVGINWAQVAATGLTFAIAKATEGLTIQDPQFPNNWPGMKANGVIRGAYHFFRSADDGTAQADAFLAEVSQYGGFQPGDLPPFLDWEVTDTTNAQAIQGAQAFIAEIQAKTGLTTIIYTDPGFWSGLGSPSQFGNNPLWIANIQVSCPDVPTPWSNWLFWQNSWTGTVNGMNCTGACDLDEFNGTLQQLQAIAVGGDGGVVVTSPDGGTPPPDGGIALPASVLPQLSGNDAVTLVNWPDEHMTIFARSVSGAALHSDTTGAGDSWSTPAQLDVGAACGSAASFWGGKWLYPELFSPLTAGGTGHLWWAAGSWKTYQAYGGSGLSHLSTLVWPNGETEVFALGSDGAAWHQYWDASTTSWSGWLSLGGSSFAQGPAGIVWPDGHGELYEVDGAGSIWRSHSATGAGTDWTSFTQIGSGLASRVSPVRWSDGTVEIFARGTDDTVWCDTASPGSDFAGLSQLAAQAVAGEPSAFVNPGGGAELVARDPSGQVIDLAYSTASGSWPSSFTGLGQSAASDPFGWIRGDGAAELFAVDGNGTLVHVTRPSGGSFGSWTAIGGSIDPCAAALPPYDGGVADAGVPPTPDAGGPPAPDAGREIDAGSLLDAGQSPDAGVLGGELHDAGSGPCIDANCGNSPPPVPKQGCGCDAAGGDASILIAGLAALLARRRRR